MANENINTSDEKKERNEDDNKDIEERERHGK
jgi:hypothetical protein